MAKLETEPRLQGESSALIEWARRVVQAVNPLVDAIGPIRVPATSIIETLDGPAFRAYLPGGGGFTAGVTSAVSFNTESFDTANAFDTTNGRFTPQVAGLYQLNWGLIVQSSASNLTAAFSALLINGAEASRGSQIALGTAAGVQFFLSTGSDMAVMNGTTDYAQIGVYATAGSGTVALAAGAPFNKFSGHLARRA